MVVLADALDLAITSRRPVRAAHLAFKLWWAWRNYYATLNLNTGPLESMWLAGVVLRRVHTCLCAAPTTHRTTKMRVEAAPDMSSNHVHWTPTIIRTKAVPAIDSEKLRAILDESNH